MKPTSAIDFTDFSLRSKLIIWTEKSADCWTWQGSSNAAGYGRFKFRGTVYLAHRVAWAMENQADPGDGFIDHMCHNASCVNPTHLRLATSKQNAENLLPVRAASGFRGVHKTGNRWQAVVKHNGVLHRSKSFASTSEANEVAIELRNELFTHNLLDRIQA